MQNFLSLGYMLHVLLSVSANFPDNPRIHHFKSDYINDMDHMRMSHIYWSENPGKQLHNTIK